MGISDLTTLIKKYRDPVTTDIPLARFKGKRVAVDTMNLLVCYYGAAKADVVSQKRDEHVKGLSDESLELISHKWFSLVKVFLSRFFDANITPIMVLDGKKKEEKTDTLKKREGVRGRDAEKIQEILKKIEASEEDEDDMRRLASLRVREGTIPWDWLDRMTLFFRGLGLPVLEAHGDGEILCSSLVASGEAAAVYSSDTDTLACGTPIVITKIKVKRYQVFDPKKGEPVYRRGNVCECFCLDNILEAMGLTQQKFRWLCIMLGNDFNKRVSGIGPVKSYKRIENANSWEEAVDGLDSECLNYDLCMRLFKRNKDWKSLTDDEEIRTGDVDRDVIGMLGESPWFSEKIGKILELK